MKNKNIQTFLIAVGLMLTLGACKKEADNIFNMFDDVSVTFHGDDPLSVTDYKEVTEGEEVVIDYTINSANKDMHAIAILKAGDNRPILTTVIPDGENKRSYSGVYKFKAEKAGKVTYRVYALNNRAVYMGDGYKSVTVDVKPNFTYVANRRVYLPDTTTRVNPSFYSINKGEVYSYTNGKVNSANIDFGVYRTMATVNGNTVYTYNMYSLSVPQSPLTVYNISDWEKRGTKFSAPQSGKTSLFNNTLVSGLALETEAKKVSINLLATTTGLALGRVVFFLTPEGKYGAIHINQITEDIEGKPFISISVKVQK